MEQEVVVRPFETNEVTPSQTYFPAGQVGVENVTLRIGRGGQGKVMNGSFSFNMSLHVEEHEVEKDTPPNDKERHIVRIQGENDRGTKLPDVWIDVERRDLITLRTRNKFGHRQTLKLKLRWMDRPDEYEGKNKRRSYESLKICAVEDEDKEKTDNYKNPKVFVRLDVIRELYFRVSGEHGYRRFQVLPQKDKESGRDVEKRRITHSDTNIDERARRQFELGAETYLVDNPDDYEKLDSKPERREKFKDDYVEVEVPSKVKNRSTKKQVEVPTHMLWTDMKNQDLIDDSDPAKEEEEFVGEDGINPPYRLDPFQNIINVSFGGLAVEFEEGDT